MGDNSKTKVISITIVSLLIVFILLVFSFMVRTKKMEKINIESQIAYIDISYETGYYRIDVQKTIDIIVTDFNNTTLVNSKATNEDFLSTPIIIAFYDTDTKLVYSCELYESGLYKGSKFYKYTENSSLNYDTIIDYIKEYL